MIAFMIVCNVSNRGVGTVVVMAISSLACAIYCKLTINVGQHLANTYAVGPPLAQRVMLSGLSKLATTVFALMHMIVTKTMSSPY